MGIAASDLPLISTVVLEFVIVPFVMSLWFNSVSLLSFGMTLFLLTWEYSVRFAFGLDNPVAAYVGTEALDAQMVFVGTLGILAFCSSMIGSFYGYVLDLPELNPINALLPASHRSVVSFRGQFLKKKNRKGELEEDPETPPRDSSHFTFLHRGKYLHIQRPYFYCFVVTVLFLLGVPLPHIIYSMTMDSWHIIGLVCVTVIPAVVYVILVLFLYYRPNLFATGASSQNVKDYNRFHSSEAGKPGFEFLPPMMDKDGNETGDFGFVPTAKEKKATKMRAIYIGLIIGIPHVLTNLTLGLIRFFKDDVNWSWIAGAVILGLILVFTIAFGIYFWWMTSSKGDDDDVDEFACEMRPSRKENDSELEEVVTTTTTTEGGDGSIVQSKYGYGGFGSDITNRFAGSPALGLVFFGPDVANNTNTRSNTKMNGKNQ